MIQLQMQQQQQMQQQMQRQEEQQIQMQQQMQAAQDAQTQLLTLLAQQMQQPQGAAESVAVPPPSGGLATRGPIPVARNPWAEIQSEYAPPPNKNTCQDCVAQRYHICLH